MASGAAAERSEHGVEAPWGGASFEEGPGGEALAPAPTGPRRGEEPFAPEARPLEAWAAPGRVLELSGAGGVAARTSAAVALVAQAQRLGEPVAWVEAAEPGGLYPPDLAEAGVDLDALVVVRIPTVPAAEGRGPAGGSAAPLARAAELLLRSGGFGLVVVDLIGVGAEAGRRADVWLGRLAGLARRHGARVALLTAREAEAESLGAVVSARLAPRRIRVGAGFYRLEAEVRKDKAGTGGTPAAIPRRAPWGAP